MAATQGRVTLHFAMLNELAINTAIQPVQTSTERQDTFVIDTAKFVLPLRVVDTARLVETSAAEHGVKAEPRRMPKEIYEDASNRISQAGRDRQMLFEKKEPQTVALGPQAQLPRPLPPQTGSTKMHTPGMFAAIPSQLASYEETQSQAVRATQEEKKENLKTERVNSS